MTESAAVPKTDLINVYQDDDMGLVLELVQGCIPFLHFDVQNFSLSVYKRMWEYWPQILEKFKELGFESVHSCIPKDEVHIQKFQSCFGLEPFKETGDYIIYRLELQDGN